MAKNDPKAFLARKKKAIATNHQTHELTNSVEEFESTIDNLSNRSQQNTDLEEKADRLIKLLQKIKSSSTNGINPTSKQLLDNLIEKFSPQGIVEIDINKISPSEQPRVTFNNESLTKLARSIETHTQLVPIIVIEAPGNKYKIFDGERRWRAIGGILKRPTIKAIVIGEIDSNFYRQVLIANIHREDLNALDKAIAIVSEIQIVNPALDRATIITKLRTFLRRHERAKTSNLISALVELPVSLQQNKLNQLDFKDEIERTIVEVILGLQLNPGNILRSIFPALNLSDELQLAVRSRDLGVAQAIEINKLSPAKFETIDRDRAFIVIGDLKEKIIEERLSVRETKALIKETIEQYSADCTDRFEKIEKWLKSFDDSAIDHLNDQERSRLKQALIEKIQLLDRTPQ